MANAECIRRGDEITLFVNCSLDHFSTMGSLVSYQEQDLITMLMLTAKVIIMVSPTMTKGKLE